MPGAMRSVRANARRGFCVFPRGKELPAGVQEMLFRVGLIGVVVLESSLNRT